MSQKFNLIILTSWVLLTLSLTSGGANIPGYNLAAKDYTAEQFDVNMIAKPDGSILVTETVVFRFTGGPFSYVFRELPTDYTDGITGITASMDAVPFPVGEGVGHLEVKGQNPIRATWHFPPIYDSTHTFILSYRVLGVTQVAEKFDLLRWNAVPFDHDYPIQSSAIRITYPRRSKLVGTPEINLEKGQFETSDYRVIYRAKNLKKDQGIQISLQFARNSLISEPPIWQKHRVATTQAIYRILPWALATFTLLLIAGVGVLFLFWEQNANIDRPDSPAPVIATRPISPPSDLSPAFVGVLLGNSPGGSWTNALATMLDLARRGVLSIEESGKPRKFHQRTFSVRLNSESEELSPHERGLLELLFKTKQGLQTRVKLTELNNILPAHFRKFSDPLRQAMETAGFLSITRSTIRNRMRKAGIALLLSGLTVLILSLVIGGVSIGVENWTAMNMAAIALSIAGSASLVGLIVIILSGLYSPLTAKGVEEAGSWRAYAEYLRDITRERETVSRPDLFESALPYVASFGLAEAWSKYFQKRGEVHIPPWFHALSTAGDQDSIAAFVAWMAASNATVSGDGGASGAGAAGGGSSGAG